MSAYRKLAKVTPDVQVVFPRRPDYLNPPTPNYRNRQCPKCGAEGRDYNKMAPRYCLNTDTWWFRLWNRNCPTGEHLHQRCTECGARWTTGVLKQ